MSDTSVVGIEALSGAFIALTTITIGFRFYARKKQGVPWLADDWTMLVAVLSFLATVSCVLVLAHVGWIGFTNYPFPKDELIPKYDQSFKLILAFDSTSTLCLGLTKASALLLYRRIFCMAGPRKGTFHLVIIGTLVLIACWMVIFIFLAIFQCHGHFSNLWNPSVYAEFCTISTNYLYALYVSDVILDVWVLALPIPKILGLHMTPTKKLSIVGVFLLAFVGIAASIVRLVNFVQIAILGHGVNGPEDPITKFTFFQVLELGMSIIAINMPTVWTAFVKMGPEAMVRMVRSMTSLASHAGSGDSKHSHTDRTQPPLPERSSSSGSSAHGVFHGDKVTSEAYAMHTVGPPHEPRLCKHKILVEDSIHVTSGKRDTEEV